MLSDAVPDTPMLAVAVEYAAALVGLVTAIVGATTSVVPAEGELGAAEAWLTSLVCAPPPHAASKAARERETSSRKGLHRRPSRDALHAR